MISVETAIRAYVTRQQERCPRASAPAYRATRYGERVLVFDTETTTDASQKLLFGFFRVYEKDVLKIEGIIVADDLNAEYLNVIETYAGDRSISPLPILSRERFVQDIFYPEVYEIGTLCVGFNLPFDLSRIAIHAAPGLNQNVQKFRLTLTKNTFWPHMRIERISGRGAFIEFAPKSKATMTPAERPFFKGRFLDLSTLASAFAGSNFSLRSACGAFGTFTSKMESPTLGAVDRASLIYGRQDVRCTWALFKALRVEYERHPFATYENERDRPVGSRYMGEIFSAASIAKQYLKLMDVPASGMHATIDPVYQGYGAAAYFGGRAEVRVRKKEVPVTVVDVTSMYPSVVILQELQRLFTTKRIAAVDATEATQAFLERITIEEIYDHSTWPNLNRLVLIKPEGDIVPVRFWQEEAEVYGISVTHFHADEPRWYTLADLLAAKILGGKVPKVIRALEFQAEEPAHLSPVLFRGSIELDSTTPIFKTVVEHRQLYRKAPEGSELHQLQLGLKIFANSGSYGIFAETNTIPPTRYAKKNGTVYSDVQFDLRDVQHEQHGDYCNMVIGSLITGGARLVLAMIEAEVVARGGIYAFCDTDSLAIVSGTDCPADVPCLTKDQVDEVVERISQLNCYDKSIIDKFLKVEYSDVKDLRCFAVAAKRYVLFSRNERGVIDRIVKPSEIALGGILGRTPKEAGRTLAARIWWRILANHVNMRPLQRHRIEQMTNFEVPLRRQLPISQPSILRRSGFRNFNRDRVYAERIKPFSFVQVATAAMSTKPILPIAPFEKDLRKSRNLPWIDYYSGEQISIDWSGQGHAGAIPIMTLSEYVNQYENHAESKAASAHGRPSQSDTCGVLYRLHLRSIGDPIRVGKEINRLDEADGVSLGQEQPTTYGMRADRLLWAISLVRQHRQEDVAREIGISSRRLRDILGGVSKPHAKTRRRLLQVAIDIDCQRLSLAAGSNARSHL